MKRIVIAVLALACCLMPARSVYAADAGVEFGAADDLSVLGNEGSTVDPDMEVKGFTVFGATQTAFPGISAGPGNVVVNGQLFVASGAYLVGGTTVTTGAYFAGASTFNATVNFASDNSIYVGGGSTNQVLKKAANGAMVWAADNDGGSGGITGTPLRLLMIEADGIGATASVFQQSGEGTANIGLTMIGTSSMTILGNGTDGLGVFGATKLNGSLDVTGPTTLLGATYLGAAATRSTFTAAGDIYLASGSSITLKGANAQIYLPNAPVLGYDAANKAYVDSRITAGGPWTRVDAINAVKLSTAVDNVGVGIAVPRAKLHVASAAIASDNLFAVSTGTLNSSQDVFAIDVGAGGVGEAGIKGNLAIGQTYASGSAPANGIAVEGAVAIGATAPDAATKLQIKGGSVSGDYIAKFYSNADLAAWIKKK